LANNVEKESTTVLIVGYCSPQTPGGQLRNGANELYLFGEKKQVNAQIEMMDSFSAHADRLEMLNFMKNQKNSLKKLFLVHGEPDTQAQFKIYLEENGFDKTDISMPALGDEIVL
jgi:metallo-beta-lactamase family protein